MTYLISIFVDRLPGIEDNGRLTRGRLRSISTEPSRDVFLTNQQCNDSNCRRTKVLDKTKNESKFSL